MTGVWLLSALFLLLVGIATGIWMSSRGVRTVSNASQEKLRRTVEQAEWQLNQMTRTAFEAMTKAARGEVRTGWRE